MPSDSGAYMSIRAAADFLGCTEYEIRVLMDDGRLAYERFGKGGKKRKPLRDSVRAFADPVVRRLESADRRRRNKRRNDKMYERFQRMNQVD
jgi:hypothetical protein